MVKKIFSEKIVKDNRRMILPNLKSNERRGGMCMLVVYVSVACKYIVETKEITNGRSKFYDINVKTEKKVVDIS